MKLGIYIYMGTNNMFSGVSKKIDNQIKAFSNYFEMCRVVIDKEKTSIAKSICWRLPGGSWGANYEKCLERIDRLNEEIKEPYFFYIRKCPLDRRYTLFLESLRRKYPKARIILEIPTYPYDKELLRSKTMWPWFFKDKRYRRQLVDCVDRITTLEDSASVFGIPTLRIFNGIDVLSTKPISRDNNDDNLIKIIAVAMMQPYHGYERLIRGLATYYSGSGNRSIKLFMVGYGDESDNYEKLVKELNMDDRVFFLGKLEGEALDDAFEACDLAVGSLGGYKIGVKQFASIKLGEYLAKGLPVITGAPAYPFTQFGNRFNLDFPNDSSEIDMNKVIDFHDRLYKGKDKSEIRSEIRKMALKSVDIGMSMNSVIEYLLEKE